MPDLIRLVKDLGEVNEMRNVKLAFPLLKGKTIDNVEEEDFPLLVNFEVTLKVSEGLYKNKWYTFRFTIPEDWPNVQPDVKIVNPIWHPNIELASKDKPGRVCVSTLKNNYLGTMLMMNIVESLKFLLLNPNPDDALNVDAAQEFKKNYDIFKANAIKYLDDMESDDEEDDNKKGK